MYLITFTTNGFQVDFRYFTDLSAAVKGFEFLSRHYTNVRVYDPNRNEISL